MEQYDSRMATRSTWQGTSAMLPLLPPASYSCSCSRSPPPRSPGAAGMRLRGRRGPMRVRAHWEAAAQGVLRGAPGPARHSCGSSGSCRPGGPREGKASRGGAGGRGCHGDLQKPALLQEQVIPCRGGCRARRKFKAAGGRGDAGPLWSTARARDMHRDGS